MASSTDFVKKTNMPRLFPALRLSHWIGIRLWLCTVHLRSNFCMMKLKVGYGMFCCPTSTEYKLIQIKIIWRVSVEWDKSCSIQSGVQAYLHCSALDSILFSLR